MKHRYPIHYFDIIRFALQEKCTPSLQSRFKGQKVLGLPDPHQAKTHDNSAVCAAANSEIEKDLLRNESEKWKSRSYHRNTPELRAIEDCSLCQ